MTARRLAAVLAAIALVGCSSSADDPDLVPDTTPDTIVSDDELLDGVFEENDGEREPGDTSDPSTDEPDSTAPTTSAVADDGESTTGGTDTGAGDSATTSTTSSTTSGSSTTGGTTGGSATSGDATTTGGSTTGGSTTGGSATTTGSATTGGTDGSSSSVGSTGDVEALTGVVTIGDDIYTFPIDGCNVLNEETSAIGESVRDGIPFIARVTSSLIDLNDDGSDERTIQINLETNPDAEGTHPDFYVVGIQSTTVSTKYDLDFSVTRERITASGPIEDNNRVAIPEGETLPMTADLRCA